jgi:hypothetical protein
MRTHRDITDGEIRDLMHRALALRHFAFAEVCMAALERVVLPGNPSTDESRARCADAWNTGRWDDLLSKDLPPAEQERFARMVWT